MEHSRPEHQALWPLFLHSKISSTLPSPSHIFPKDGDSYPSLVSLPF
jgi:hypothetical protein